MSSPPITQNTNLYTKIYNPSPVNVQLSCYWKGDCHPPPNWVPSSGRFVFGNWYLRTLKVLSNGLPSTTFAGYDEVRLALLGNWNWAIWIWNSFVTCVCSLYGSCMQYRHRLRFELLIFSLVSKVNGWYAIILICQFFCLIDFRHDQNASG